MSDSIELELEALDSANLSHLAPGHLFNYFKEELNDKILINLVNDLDNVIHTIDTNNSFKILSLNDNHKSQEAHEAFTCGTSSQNSSLSSSLSETTLDSCKLILGEISSKLNEIFTKYYTEIKYLINLFEKQQLKQESKLKTESNSPYSFADRKELLDYQRAILVQKLSTKHYDLLNLLFRNVFDYYQRSCHQEIDDDCEPVEVDYEEKAHKMNKEKLLIENFESINRTIFDMDLFDHLCGDIVVGVVQNKIRLHIESTSMDNYQESFIKSFEFWLEKIIIGWIKLIYSSSTQFTLPSINTSSLKPTTTVKQCNGSKFDQYLLNYKKQLSHFMYTHYAHIRIKRLFDIVIDFPDSKSAVDDLKLCLEKTNLRAHVIKTLKSSIEQRLLHPGVNTSDILTAYVSAIKALISLDSSGVMMENVCEPLKRYLRNRDDTVKCIVSNLTDDGDTSNDLMEEFCKDLGAFENAQDIIDSNMAVPMVIPTDGNENKSKIKSWEMWVPDPIDAVSNAINDGSNMGSKSNIITMLVNIYGSKDLFVNEYKTLLGDRLLSSYSFNMEKEIRNLELLKLRFGDSNLFSCEAMLKDISESKRINANILEQFKQKDITKIETLEDISSNNLKCLILSEQFWPKLKEEKVELNSDLKEIQEKFIGCYEAFKGNRTLIWKNNLGQVTIDLEINGKVLEFNVTPIQCAVIMKFQEKETWSLQELSQSMKMCSFVLRKKLTFWKMQGVIKQSDENANAQLNVSVNPDQMETNTASEIYSLVKEAGKLNKSRAFVEDEEEAEKSAQSSVILKEQEMTLYWNYTQSMLRGCGCLPIDRIHTWLKLYASSDLTIEQVRYLVDTKTKEQLLKYHAGLYRLNK